MRFNYGLNASVRDRSRTDHRQYEDDLCYATAGFCNVIACIDGTHVKLQTPLQMHTNMSTRATNTASMCTSFVMPDAPIFGSI